MQPAHSVCTVGIVQRGVNVAHVSVTEMRAGRTSGAMPLDLCAECCEIALGGGPDPVVTIVHNDLCERCDDEEATATLVDCRGRETRVGERCLDVRADQHTWGDA
jgi:hypothetical protein